MIHKILYRKLLMSSNQYFSIYYFSKNGHKDFIKIVMKFLWPTGKNVLISSECMMPSHASSPLSAVVSVVLVGRDVAVL